MSIDPNLSLVVEAKGCKYTLIPKNYTYDEVLQMWQYVSSFIIKRLVQRKAVNIHGLGMFSILKRNLDIGNNGKLCIQRPIFVLSEKFAQTHVLRYTKYQSLGEVPVTQLNYAEIATDLGIDRNVVEVCIKELIGAFARTIGKEKKGELAFKDIGNLVVKNNKAKMKFCKEFLQLIDGSSIISLTPISLGRPKTSDSFVSQNSVMSTTNDCKSDNLILPKIKNSETCDRPPSVISNTGPDLVLSPVNPLYEDLLQESKISEENASLRETAVDSVDVTASVGTEEKDPVPENEIATSTEQDNIDMVSSIPVPPCSSTLDPIYTAPPISQHKKLKNNLKPSNLKSIKNDAHASRVREKSRNVQFIEDVDIDKSAENPDNEHRCSHHSGQELCYLCHQRQEKNLPISFAEEKNRYELEQDRVLQQYQELKDQEFYDHENKYMQRERQICKKVAQFNLETSERLKKEKVPSSEYHHSYIFNRQGDLPQRYLTQEQYCESLGEQVRVKSHKLKKLKDAKDMLEKSEQKYLAKELAEASKQFFEAKTQATKQYQATLCTQVKNKPFRLPKAEPDSVLPIFGTTDMSRDKLMGVRKRAKDVLNHQLHITRIKKEKGARENELNRRYETEVLKRAKKELQRDNYRRFQVDNTIRKELESSWTHQHREKIRQDTLERKHQMTAGLLLLDQCDKYSRCKQCERCCANIGASNVWRESRYMSGSRLMV